MEKEYCPMCKSEFTTAVEVAGEWWWRCEFQGCAGRVSGDAYHFRPGQGLSEEEAKARPKPKAKPKPAGKDGAAAKGAKPAGDAAKPAKDRGVSS